MMPVALVAPAEVLKAEGKEVAMGSAVTAQVGLETAAGRAVATGGGAAAARVAKEEMSSTK